MLKKVDKKQSNKYLFNVRNIIVLNRKNLKL